MTQSIVINNCFGGFGLSPEAFARYVELRGLPVPTDNGEAGIFHHPHTTVDGEHFSYYDILRDDPFLVQTVREMGKAASGWAAALCVVEIPDDVEWDIHEYDGSEHVMEQHRTWYA